MDTYFLLLWSIKVPVPCCCGKTHFLCLRFSVQLPPPFRNTFSISPLFFLPISSRRAFLSDFVGHLIAG
ncbi:Uncharacterized protein APZ42_026076 [Daphnia magna]|uniref:Uncharacterized protein n=1 Tax=Daphnia magna TaxID=35525 RepID=A0A162EE31_9CRUS|nr:Uncharacterized protein APZ42_026076 [Daphnia magna]